MKNELLLVVFLFGGFLNLAGQKKLTNQEIINSWCSSKEKRDNIKDSIDVSFDKEVNNRVREFVDSLGENNIDFILIYTKSYPGYLIINKPCFAMRYPVYTYVIWQSKTELNVETIASNCKSKTTLRDSFDIFNYFTKNKQEIVKECVMPVIFSAQRTKNESIIYSMSQIDHEPNYLLEFRVGKMYKEIHFAESFLQNKESLFLEIQFSP